MSSEGALEPTGAERVAETAWGHLSAGQLLDRLEWAYGETGGFEPEVVWELARRVIDQG